MTILFLALTLSCLTSCKPSVIYLTGGQKVIHVKEGQTMTVTGPAWVTSDEGMAGHYDYLEDKVRAREAEPD